MRFYSRIILPSVLVLQSWNVSVRLPEYSSTFRPANQRVIQSSRMLEKCNTRTEHSVVLLANKCTKTESQTRVWQISARANANLRDCVDGALLMSGVNSVLCEFSQ